MSLTIATLDSRSAAHLVVAKHYLHRRPPIPRRAVRCAMTDRQWSVADDDPHNTKEG